MQMLKRLSYPLTWMGESLSGGEQSKEGSPIQQVSDAANPNAESVFSKVFSRCVSFLLLFFFSPSLRMPRHSPWSSFSACKAFFVFLFFGLVWFCSIFLALDGV